MPRTPVIQHQKTAPGPPSETAVDIPMIFPVPIVAASVVIRAENALCEADPEEELCLGETDSLIPRNTWRWTPCRWMVK